MTDPHLALPHTSESYRVLGYTEDRIRKRFWRCVRTYFVSICHVVRAVVAAKPGPYERAWLTSINAVGLIVVLAVIFDISTLLGSGRSGVFQRALYPLVPPAVTLGVALAIGKRRGVSLSAGLLIGYVGLLAAVGTLQASLASAPAYPAAAVVGVAVTAALGYVGTRRTRR